MDRVTQALGKGDEDVMNMKAGIAGLVFGNWSDAEIAAAAVEMAQDSRRELAEAIKAPTTDQS
jgi:hypothetical protein